MGGTHSPDNRLVKQQNRSAVKQALSKIEGQEHHGNERDNLLGGSACIKRRYQNIQRHHNCGNGKHRGIDTDYCKLKALFP